MNSVKKSDGNKAWLKRREPAKYKIGKLNPHKRILIVCEGQTEKLYFESFPVIAVIVTCLDMGGQTKKKLVEECAKRIIEYKRDHIIFDEIWCVFDMDKEKGEKEFADYDTSIYMAEKKKYKVAYSNDSFELWFYLHYQYTDQQNLRAFYYEQLSYLWGYNYAVMGKTASKCKGNYRRLENDERADQEKAIQRAKRLYEEQNHLLFHEQNPVTTVYKLVMSLNENMKK
jgi:hypothetical protein